MNRIVKEIKYKGHTIRLFENKNNHRYSTIDNGKLCYESIEEAKMFAKIRLTEIDQVNMLIKHANRNGIKIQKFEKTATGSNVVYARCDGFSYFTIYCIVKNADYVFELV